MKYVLVGDIHGDYTFFMKICKKYTDHQIIQVGDFGVGFKPIPDYLNNKNFNFIRGNHDNPNLCLGNSHYIEDGSYLGPFFCVGGAYSIDKDYRTPFVDWWPNEELTYLEFKDIMDKYEELKPDYVITHDCPVSVLKQIHEYQLIPGGTITNQALDIMFSIHQPKLWIFGHHHLSFDKIINGTRFVCLNINEVLEIEI